MKEIQGNLWDYYGRPNHAICITTNGTLKKNGQAVMGRGCAREAATKVPKLPTLLGWAIKANGNTFQGIYAGIFSFPVKHNWWETADLALIRASAMSLLEDALENQHCIYILPRPGCGNGKLEWVIVKPLLEDLPDNVWVISP